LISAAACSRLCALYEVSEKGNGALSCVAMTQIRRAYRGLAADLSGGQAMQRPDFWRLYARLVSFHRATASRISAHGEASGTSASPVLVYAAAALFLILAILEVDLHRDELRALGLVSSDQRIELIAASP
jgi:hypothetical protein